MPHLRVLAGTSPDTLVPITHVVNTNKPFRISSELFDGEIVANIKGFADDEDRVLDSEYFHREDRQGITWSIQVQGRFLKPYSADDILFGNTFDRPLNLPWGSNVGLKFMKFIDPTLDHDLTSTKKPWALSPLVATMPHFVHRRLREPELFPPPFPPKESLSDDTSQLHLALVTPESSGSSSPGSSSSSLSSSQSARKFPSLTGHHSSSSGSSVSSFLSTSSAKSDSHKPAKNKPAKVSKSKKRASEHGSFNFTGASQRRSYFSSSDSRKAVTFGPNDVITTDFCYGFIEFSPTLSLRLPGGISFDLMRYWDGQPVRFVCCERKGVDDDQGEPWGRIFWCVVVELCEDEK